jgi:hypothetical protein
MEIHGMQQGLTLKSIVTSNNSLGLACIGITYSQLCCHIEATQYWLVESVLFQKYQLAAIFWHYNKDICTSANM